MLTRFRDAVTSSWRATARAAVIVGVALLLMIDPNATKPRDVIFERIVSGIFLAIFGVGTVIAVLQVRKLRRSPASPGRTSA